MRVVHLAIAPLQSKYTEYQVLAFSGLWFVSGLPITVLPNKPHHAPIVMILFRNKSFIFYQKNNKNCKRTKTIVKLSTILTLWDLKKMDFKNLNVSKFIRDLASDTF